MKTAHKLLSLAGLIVALLVASAGSAQAAQFTSLKLTLGSSAPQANTSHTFAFTHPSNATIKEIRFRYCAEASGTAGSCTTPPNLNTLTAAEGTISGLNGANFSLLSSVAQGASQGHYRFQHTGVGEVTSTNDALSLGFTNIRNHSIGDCNPVAGNSSDTCYVRVTSYSDAGVTAVDSGIVSYTVVDDITVTARVDPSFTFVVGAVAANTANNSITTSVASTFDTLPFGNLTAGTPKYAAHSLRVTTNTQSGYTVYARMSTQMAGVYSANNIDPFIAGWATPTSWTEPTGTTPNTNTGWIGANSTDADITAWGPAVGAIFGDVAHSGTGNAVSYKASSDNGATPVYVTYAIEANVFQPADTYTGTLIYNALPTY